MPRDPHRSSFGAKAFAALALSTLTAAACQRSASSDEFVKLSGTIPLQGVEGRLDHLLLDRLRDRLYIAAPENHSIEIVDVKSGKVWKSHRVAGDPVAFAFVSGATPSQDAVVCALGPAKRLWIGNAESGESNLLVELDAPAGCLRYQDATSRLYTAHGDASAGGLTVLEVNGWKREAAIALAGAPASFQIESQGTRVFVNVPSANHIAVVDSDSKSVLDKYVLQNVKGNFPMFLDERIGRLFVGCRDAASLLVMDTRTGDLVGSFPCAPDPRDVGCDFAKGRVYVACGEGVLDVFEHQRPDTYTRVGRVETRSGPGTSLFIAAQRKFYVALPRLGDAPAEVRVYDVP